MKQQLDNKLIIIIFLLIIIFLIGMYLLYLNQKTSSKSDKIYIVDNNDDNWLRRDYWFRRKYKDTDRIFYERELDRVRDDTQKKIRELEQQVQESNQEPVNTNGVTETTQPASTEPEPTEPEPTEPAPTTESFQNNDKLYLFYTISCPYSQAILPIWYRVIDALPKSCSPIEKDCSKLETRPTCSAFGITGVPTIILEKSVDGNLKRVQYSGDNTFNSIRNFLKNHNIILTAFQDVGKSSHGPLNPEAYNNVETFQNIDEIKRESPNLEIGVKDTQLGNRLIKNQADMCPDITYDKNLDRSVEKYYFQVFNELGQHGYSTGGVGEPLDKFHAAYNVVDTYLSSLPDPELMDVCAKKNRKMIREFALCDEKKLNKILSYPDLIESGKTDPRIEGIDYESNKKVINSIKKACSIN
jgi:hypothetical protein